MIYLTNQDISHAFPVSHKNCRERIYDNVVIGFIPFSIVLVCIAQVYTWFQTDFGL